MFSSKDKKDLPSGADSSVGVAGDYPTEGGGGVAGPREREVELSSSFSPHRTISQQIHSHGTGMVAGLESDSGSYSPHSSLPLQEDVLLHLQSQQNLEEEEELVIRKPKTKSKTKKKKKKKKAKAADAGESQLGVSGVSGGQDQVDSNAVQDLIHPTRNESSRGQPEPGQPEPSPPDSSRLQEEVEEGRGKGVEPVESEGQEVSWDHWAAGEGSGLVERRQFTPPPKSFQSEGYLEEEEEEMGFGRGHQPMPLPQSTATKRLSLADELEMAMEGSAPPLGPEGRDDEDNGDTVFHPNAAEPDSNQRQATPNMVALLTTPPKNTTHDNTDDIVKFPNEKVVSDEGNAQDPGSYLTTPTIIKAIKPHPLPFLEPAVYDGSPVRPREITENDKRANDKEMDDNTRLVISLDVLHQHDEEELLRLVQVATPTGVGLQRTCYVLITSHSTYILRKGET